MMKVESHRDLRIWQLGMDLAVEAYRLTKRFPSSEHFNLTSQIQRSASSVPAQIAEGHPKGTKEYLYKLTNALGELVELQTHIELAGRLGYLSEEQVVVALDHATQLAKQINAARAGVRRRAGLREDEADGREVR